MEPDGYRHGLRAGANLVTMNLTPGELRADYVIYQRDRFIMTEERVLSALAAEGLEPSKTGLADFYRPAGMQRARPVNPVWPPPTRPDFTCFFHRQPNPDPPSRRGDRGGNHHGAGNRLGDQCSRFSRRTVRRFVR